LTRHILPRSPLTQCCSHKPFVLSLWFDRLTTIGFFPNVLSKVEGQAQGERLLPFMKGGKNLVSSVYSMMDRLIRRFDWDKEVLKVKLPAYPAKAGRGIQPTCP